MENFVKRTWAEINMDAIAHNYNIIRQHVNSQSKMCCVVKADGYGHGAVKVALEYHKLGADWFAVSNIEEALQLRENSIAEPILILGYTPENMAKALSDHDISQAVYSLDYAKVLSQNAAENNVNVKIHIKLDTGMSRIGLMCQEIGRDDKAVDEAEEICKLPNLISEGVFTHFAVSDEGDEGRDFTNKQFDSFMHTIKALEERGVHFKIRHCANSGAIIDYPDMHLDMVRAGIILYGLSPSQKLKDKLNIIPAMELKSVVSNVKEIEKGATVSYGRTFKADRKMKIATVPIGYADGYIRTLAKDAYLTVNNAASKVVGRICMDQTMADVSNIDNIKRGDIVTVFGNGTDNAPTADHIAKWSNTINYEVTCLVGKRVARVYLKDGKITDTHTLL